MRSGRAGISYGSIRVIPMSLDHVQESAELWLSRYRATRGTLKVLPEMWGTDPSHIRAFIESHVEDRSAYIAECGGELAGYMAFDAFTFHGERTAFCPIMGHASVDAMRATVYRKMYGIISGLWVGDGALSHIFTYYSCDDVLRDAFYGLGFGLYAVDCFGLPEPEDGPRRASIREGTEEDLPELIRLVEDSRLFYREPPTFLVTEKKDEKYFRNLLDEGNGQVFFAEDGGRMVGFIYIRRNTMDDAITLTPRGVGIVSAYLEASARGRNIGDLLLGRVVEWCRENDVSCVHVDYESANPYACVFWPRHFTQVLHSAKRRVNQDILSLHGL